MKLRFIHLTDEEKQVILRALEAYAENLIDLRIDHKITDEEAEQLARTIERIIEKLKGKV